MLYKHVFCINYNLNLIAHFWRRNYPGPSQLGDLYSTESLENISNTPKQCGSGLKFCLNSSANFFNFQCACVPDRRAGDATEWQGDFRGSAAGVRLEREAHVEQMVPLWFPYEGQLGHPGTQWTVVCAACLHLWSCLSGKVSFCFAVEKLKGHLISSPVDLCDLWNCGALGGFSTPPSPGDCAVITPCPGLAVYLLDAGGKHTSVPVRGEPGCCLTRSGVFVSSAFASECTAAQLGQKLQPPSPCWCKTGMVTQKHLKLIRNPLNLWMGRAERLKGH